MMRRVEDIIVDKHEGHEHKNGITNGIINGIAVSIMETRVTAMWTGYGRVERVTRPTCA